MSYVTGNKKQTTVNETVFPLSYGVYSRALDNAHYFRLVVRVQLDRLCGFTVFDNDLLVLFEIILLFVKPHN